jgi:hypothetical protein
MESPKKIILVFLSGFIDKDDVIKRNRYNFFMLNNLIFLCLRRKFTVFKTKPTSKNEIASKKNNPPPTTPSTDN